MIKNKEPFHCSTHYSNLPSFYYSIVIILRIGEMNSKSVSMAKMPSLPEQCSS
jgi:hypothetical protein